MPNGFKTYRLDGKEISLVIARVADTVDLIYLGARLPVGENLAHTKTSQTLRPSAVCFRRQKTAMPGGRPCGYARVASRLIPISGCRKW
jgi:hypothetical protein